MEQLPQELYLIVLEYSPGLSEKQILEKQQLNGRCLQEVVGSPFGRAALLSVGVGVLPAPLSLSVPSVVPVHFAVAPLNSRAPAGPGLVLRVCQERLHEQPQEGLGCCVRLPSLRLGHSF